MQIHELNNFSGTPGASDYFATDNGTDTSKISATDLYAPLNARIDNIIAGPAPSAEEIIDARVGANGVTYSSLGDAIRGQFLEIDGDIGVAFPTYSSISGKYIGSDSVEKNGANFSRSYPIAVTKGSVIEFTATGYNANVAMIATSDSGGTSFQAKVKSVDSNEHTYEYVVEDDGFIVVSYLTSRTHHLVLKSVTSNAGLNNRVNILETSGAAYLSYEAETTIYVEDTPVVIAQTGRYITNSGDYASNVSFNLSEVLSLVKGQSIIFNSKGYLQSVAVLARMNEDSTYTPLVLSIDSDEHRYVYTAPTNMNVVISTHKTVSPRYSIISSKLGKLENRIEGKDFVAFATMGVLGDSLASGASNYGESGAEDRKVYSWGKYIQREHGISVDLFSSGGATTRSWLIQPYGLTALQNADILDCYVIGLGVNDAYSLGSAYLGSISDVHVGNEGANADTYYGNYSKIIAAIKAKSPRAKIICLTNPRGTTGTAANYNEAVRTIVPLYTNTYLVDLVTDSFYTSADFRDTWYGAHSTALGYKLIARNLYNHISDLIQNDIGDFTDIQWIAQNHA